VTTDRADYRRFLYPLNVFMHILTEEEGEVSYLHYGIFERGDETLAEAQERSTALIVERLPPPPCSILEAGIGLGTTMVKLTAMGYQVEGITPDANQVALVRSRHGEAVRVQQVSFEEFRSERRFDVILFQESSQYIDSNTLFAQAARLADEVLVLDEFALQPVRFAGALHRWDEFTAAASAHRFSLVEMLDLSAKAAPTMEYFRARIPAYRDRLVTELGLTHEQIDRLIEMGARYRHLYGAGIYGYRLARFRR
jgi:cyclopropane fatty-acyl-phospholipid synthase-like methyltransferase